MDFGATNKIEGENESEIEGDEEEVEEEGEVDPKVLISSLRRTRGIHKRKVTVHMKKLKSLHESETLTSSFCKTQIKAIENEIACIKKFDDKINEIMDSYDLCTCDEPY